jgi:hypothetical protein
MTTQRVVPTQFGGQYTGQGAWWDIDGQSKQYRVVQTILPEPTKLVVKYQHEFFQEGTATAGEFSFEFATQQICVVKLNGAEVGNGYLFDNYLHFNIRVGDIFVETSYERTDQGIVVRGSSTSNAQGKFIAWSEVLLVTS